MTNRPFHLFLALAVALWAHVCCCTPGQDPARPLAGGGVAGAFERSCCGHEHPGAPSKSPAKAPCKGPASCGRCIEKNLGLSGSIVVTPPNGLGVPVAPHGDLFHLVRAQVERIAPCAPRAYTGTSLLRLHCALIV